MSDAKTVWVLDMVGYDVRGGGAYVFASMEEAKAYVGPRSWKDDGDGGVYEDLGRDSTADIWVIYPRVIGQGWRDPDDAT